MDLTYSPLDASIKTAMQARTPKEWFDARPELRDGVKKHLKAGISHTRILPILIANFDYPFKGTSFRLYAQVLEMTP